ncbi:MAG: hypothetical protein ABUS79_11570 [Pseudomonadota bacterium]
MMVVDANPADKLYVRWVSDYPPYTANSRLLVDDVKGLPQKGLKGTEISFDAGRCEKFAMGGMEHDLVVIVADRKFRPSSDSFDSVFRFNLVENGGSYAMLGWNLVNCP